MVSMEQLHILVVDDNRINRLYLKTILTQWQHHVTEADSGLSALDICQQQSFDLILMDIRMQPMDGVTAAHKIKQLNHHTNTAIVAVSAEKIDHLKHPQFIDSLIKPLTKPVLKQLITQQSIHNTPTEQLFDEDSALAISHDDPDIVQKLRTLFIAALPEEMEKIEHFHGSKNWQALERQLHHLQGSARVCAAVVINQQINSYRQHLKKPSGHDLDNCLQQLKEIVTETLKDSHGQLTTDPLDP